MTLKSSRSQSELSKLDESTTLDRSATTPHGVTTEQESVHYATNIFDGSLSINCSLMKILRIQIGQGPISHRAKIDRNCKSIVVTK